MRTLLRSTLTSGALAVAAVFGSGAAAQGTPPISIWAGDVGQYTDASFEVPADGAPVPVRIELYASPRDGAAGMARIGGDERCAYRLTQVGTQAVQGMTVTTYDAVYAGSLNLTALSAIAVAAAVCGHATTQGRLVAAPVEGGLSAGFVGERAGAPTLHAWAVLPAAAE